MRPTGPSSPTSRPSYRSCAARMVRRELKPSFLAASCWIVLVVNGAPGFLRRFPLSTLLTPDSRRPPPPPPPPARPADGGLGLCPPPPSGPGPQVCPPLSA